MGRGLFSKRESYQKHKKEYNAVSREYWRNNKERKSMISKRYREKVKRLLKEGMRIVKKERMRN